MLVEDSNEIIDLVKKIVAVLIFKQVYRFWSLSAGEPLSTNWLPWRQRNVYL